MVPTRTGPPLPKGRKSLEQWRNEIPEDLLKEVEEENAKYLADKQKHIEKQNTLTLRVFYNETPFNVDVLRTKSLREATVRL
jgi:hypothetical protein